MTSKKHILITSSRLDVPGGIERAVVATANLFATNGHAVSVLVLDKQEGHFYPLDDAVTILYEPLHFGVGVAGNVLSRKISLLKNLLTLRSVIFKIVPDVIIASDYIHAICLRLIVPKRIKLFSWEHHHFAQLKKNAFWRVLVKQFYPKLDGVVCLNSEEGKHYKKLGCAVTVIPNFVEQKDKIAELTNCRLLTIGWLSHIKGADLIPKIADIVFKRHPEWTWKVIGSGDALIDRIDNVDVVAPMGHDITNEYLSSSIYVLPSRFECFPMVLLEAMDAGLPCVAFDCPTGPKHIITSGDDGRLIDNGNVQAMANAILELIENQEERIRLGRNAHMNIHRFNPETIYSLWKKLLQAE